MKYEINGHDVELIRIGKAVRLFGWTAQTLLHKENRGTIPPASFRTPNGARLYSIEDVAILEYMYKEVYTNKPGVKTPNWVIELFHLLLGTAKKLVIEKGGATSEEDFDLIHQKYRKYGFSKNRLWMYIFQWKSILSEEKPDFLTETVQEDY